MLIVSQTEFEGLACFNCKMYYVWLHYRFCCWWSEVKSLSHVQLFVTPWTVCSLPGSSVHGIFQARILEWVAIFFSRGSSRPRDQTQVSRIAGRLLTIWATREVSSPTRKSALKVAPKWTTSYFIWIWKTALYRYYCDEEYGISKLLYIK